MEELIEFTNNFENYEAAEIVSFLCDNNISYDELDNFMTKNNLRWDSAEKRKSVKSMLQYKENEVYKEAVLINSIESLQRYLFIYPKGNYVGQVSAKIQEINVDNFAVKTARVEHENMIRQIKEDINEFTPDEVVGKLSAASLEELCKELEIDPDLIKNYKEPQLIFNMIPQNENEVPEGYTDVFFWGIPSSGKTCALSAILSTIKKEYSMEAPDCEKKFGATYRVSLVNIFKNDYGYLPGRTNQDRTQYMPFMFYKRGEKFKRKISFFELSGEVFKYFYEIAYNSNIISDYDRQDIEKAFQTLELLLKSNNQKIHYFFIDYNQETKHSVDRNGLTQSDYLEAAATYFRDAKQNGKPVDIFKKKTDAVYVVVTKSDEIPGDNKAQSANQFLKDNFGSFMDVLQNQCKRHSVYFKVKLFSIGDVYFKKICRINRAFSVAIINDLLVKIRPVSDNKFKNFFNS